MRNCKICKESCEMPCCGEVCERMAVREYDRKVKAVSFRHLAVNPEQILAMTSDRLLAKAKENEM